MPVSVWNASMDNAATQAVIVTHLDNLANYTQPQAPGALVKAALDHVERVGSDAERRAVWERVGTDAPTGPRNREGQDAVPPP